MLSEGTRQYLFRIASLRGERGTAEPVIHVDSVSSKIAHLYEKLRQVIDYQDDHLLRKNAITRILRRRLLLSLNPLEIAEPLVLELIRGGYLANDRIPEIKIGEVQAVLEKYLFLTEYLPLGLDRGQRNELSDWLQNLSALEIEEKLSPATKELALVDYAVNSLLDKIDLVDFGLNERRKKELLFVASQKILLKSDASLLSFWLLRLKFPELMDRPSAEFLMEFAQKLPELKREIESLLSDHLLKRISLKLYRFSPAFLLLRDVALQNLADATEVFENPETLETRLKLTYEQRYRGLRKDNQRMAVRLVVSVLLSKMLLAFLIEVPFDKAHGLFSVQTLAINLFVPPFLMFLIVSSLRLPSAEKKNTTVIEALRLTQVGSQLEKMVLRRNSEKEGLAALLLNLIFLLGSSLVLALSVYGLLRLNFSWLSIIIFLAFFSLIAFSGLRIEANNRQFRGQEPEGGFLSFLADIFFMPFRTVGQWLSGQLQRYNLIIIFLNLFFEAPLQVFFEFLESWRSYLKKRKEEME